MREVIHERLHTLRRRIDDAAHAAGRDPASVRLIAVSKKQPVVAIAEALAAGQVEFGENYVQELVEKSHAFGMSNVAGPVIGHPQSRGDALWGAPTDATPDTKCNQLPTWHFIGRVQRNKLNAVLPHVQWIHSVDSLALAQAIDARAPHQINALIQINVGDETSKAGIAPEQLIPVLTACAQFARVQIRGLMCIPPPVDHADAARPYFSQLRELLNAANQANCYPTPLAELSMGMSADYSAAIAEGATMIRIGTAIFGERHS